MAKIDKYILETDDLSMTYNSARENLKIPEYGRHVQRMIQYAKEESDPKIKQQLIEQIVQLMEIMHPQNKGFEDYRSKLWKHVFEIADYELDGVLPPSGEAPQPEAQGMHPEQVAYPTSESRFRHYGHNVQVLIKKAVDMEPGPVRKDFERCIANYMKLAYRTWNREHYVSDDIIIEDLKAISDGQIILAEDTELAKVGKITTPGNNKKSNSRSRRRSGSSSNSNNNNGRRRYKRRKR